MKDPQTKEEFKGTKGKSTFHSYGKGNSGRYRFAIQVGGTTVCRILRDDNDCSDQEHANVKLICEAFNVVNETGLTPSQLQSDLAKQKQVNSELLEALKQSLIDQNARYNILMIKALNSNEQNPEKTMYGEEAATVLKRIKAAQKLISTHESTT